MDPLCGEGSIPIEAALAFPHSYVLCSDNDIEAMDRTKANINALTSGCKIDLVQWSLLKLPFKTSSIDIIVTAMPLSKSSENKSYSKIIHEQLLWEFGRVIKLKGRLVLFFYDRSHYDVVLATTELFNLGNMIHVNVGDFQAAVIVLNRNLTTLRPFKLWMVKE